MTTKNLSTPKHLSTKTSKKELSDLAKEALWAAKTVLSGYKSELQLDPEQYILTPEQSFCKYQVFNLRKLLTQKSNENQLKEYLTNLFSNKKLDIISFKTSTALIATLSTPTTKVTFDTYNAELRYKTLQNNAQASIEVSTELNNELISILMLFTKTN